MPGSAKAGSSAPYKIFETRQFLRDLAKLGPAAERRLEAKLREHVYPVLFEEPCSGPNIKRLKNWEPPTWRYRVREWRFFYEIDEARRIVYMIVADQCKAPYR